MVRSSVRGTQHPVVSKLPSRKEGLVLWVVGTVHLVQAESVFSAALHPFGATVTKTGAKEELADAGQIESVRILANSPQLVAIVAILLCVKCDKELANAARSDGEKLCVGDAVPGGVVELEIAQQEGLGLWVVDTVHLV
jgi:hypothetical protein